MNAVLFLYFYQWNSTCRSLRLYLQREKCNMTLSVTGSNKSGFLTREHFQRLGISGRKGRDGGHRERSFLERCSLLTLNDTFSRVSFFLETDGLSVLGRSFDLTPSFPHKPTQLLPKPGWLQTRERKPLKCHFPWIISNDGLGASHNSNWIYSFLNHPSNNLSKYMCIHISRS